MNGRVAFNILSLL